MGIFSSGKSTKIFLSGKFSRKEVLHKLSTILNFMKGLTRLIYGLIKVIV